MSGVCLRVATSFAWSSALPPPTPTTSSMSSGSASDTSMRCSLSSHSLYPMPSGWWWNSCMLAFHAVGVVMTAYFPQDAESFAMSLCPNRMSYSLAGFIVLVYLSICV